VKQDQRATLRANGEDGMIKPEDVGKMVTIVSMPLRVGGRIEIRCPIEEAGWLTAIFTRDVNPFRTLRDLGFEVVASTRAEREASL
jgi:hypothetical protein